MKNIAKTAIARLEDEIFKPKAKKSNKNTNKKGEKTMENTNKNTNKAAATSANATLNAIIDKLGSDAVLTILQTVALNASSAKPTAKPKAKTAAKPATVTVREYKPAPKKEKKVPKFFVSKDKLNEQRKKWANKKGVSLAVEGNWLWLSGDTKPYKDALKADGWRYTPKSKRGTWALALNNASC